LEVDCQAPQYIELFENRGIMTMDRLYANVEDYTDLQRIFGIEKDLDAMVIFSYMSDFMKRQKKSKKSKKRESGSDHSDAVGMKQIEYKNDSNKQKK
jgi:hypothetical protein